MLSWKRNNRKKIVIMVCTLLLAALFLAPDAGIVAVDQNKDAVPTARIVAGNNQFAWELYQKLKADPENKDKNIFFSPYSLSTALAMTYAGSRSNTEKQMSQVLHFTLPGQDFHQAFATLNGQIVKTDSKPYQLNIANALWGQSDYHFEAGFLGLINKYYEGRFQTVDYVNQSVESVQTINRWVEQQTAAKIKNLVHPKDVDILTRLILTNAIYFKGDWEMQFKPDRTKPYPFTLPSGKTVNAPLMRQKAEFDYAEVEGAQILELPYAGKDLAMMVILPNGDFNKFESRLTSAQIQEWSQQLVPQKVEVYLPKFKFETRYYLDQILSAMGMTDAFGADADFSGMTGKKDLYIKHVIHQAMIDVNEQGSEAAAATAVIMDTKSISINPVFQADHPFVFAIVHQPTASVLFLGRVSNPMLP